MNTSHQELLAQVGRIYERHGQTERGKRQFNIFTTLRKSSDEVNLHSRFLHALLNHREPTDDQRKNLEDFLANVADIKCFPVDGVNVHREFDNIDLLIENVQQKQAVVIENKIWSDDQDQQLQRYHKALVARGYPKRGINLLYLTPFGDPPSVQSLGDLNCKELSYLENLLPWLKRCQERAFDIPALRESIAQYRELVRKLTDTDRSAEYMADLKKLLLKGDNLIQAQELLQALVEAKSELVCNLGRAIHDEIKKIEGFPSSEDNSFAKIETVKEWVDSRKRRKEVRLSFRVDEFIRFVVHAENDDAMWYGVECEGNRRVDSSLKERFSKVSGGISEDRYPWYRYIETNEDRDPLYIRNLNPDGLGLLNSDERLRKLAKLISTQLAGLWREIKISHPPRKRARKN